MSNLFDALKVDEQYARDVRHLRESISFLSRFSDLEIYHLYEKFSDSYCAGWLITGEETIADFSRWLEQ